MLWWLNGSMEILVSMKPDTKMEQHKPCKMRILYYCMHPPLC